MPTDPTPESLALVEQIRATNVRMHGDAHSFQGEWAEYTPRLPKEEAARRIDAHVAERTMTLELNLAKSSARTAELATEKSLLQGREAALRASADAMAAFIPVLLAKEGVFGGDRWKGHELVAAYRALSSAGDAK